MDEVRGLKVDIECKESDDDIRKKVRHHGHTLFLLCVMGLLFGCRMLFLREDDLVVAAQVHEGEEAEETIIVGIKIAVLERFVLGVPEGIYELLALIMAAQHGCCCCGGNKTDGMTEFAESACLKNLSFLWKCAVGAVLIHEVVDAL